ETQRKARLVDIVVVGLADLGEGLDADWQFLALHGVHYASLHSPGALPSGQSNIPSNSGATTRPVICAAGSRSRIVRSIDPHPHPGLTCITKGSFHSAVQEPER